MATALMYHDVVSAGDDDSSGFRGRDAALYKITPDLFDAHLASIASLEQTHGPTLTFDDGGVSAMRAADALERHGLIGHFFVTVNYIGTSGFLSEPQIRELHGRRHLIGSHSCSHPLRMGHCSGRQLLDEWTTSRATLQNILSADVTVASVPGGDFAPAVAQAAAEAGLTRLFTSEPTRAMRQTGGIEIRGRFTIQRWTTAATAAALARGAWLPGTRQTLVWGVKKLTKRLGGDSYLKLRKLLLRHGNEVRWGDVP